MTRIHRPEHFLPYRKTISQFTQTFKTFMKRKSPYSISNQLRNYDSNHIYLYESDYLDDATAEANFLCVQYYILRILLLNIEL